MRVRTSVVDLTKVFCGRRRCFPVIGGALVFKDVHHLTPVFSRTLGPILQHEVAGLVNAPAPTRR